MCLTGNAANPRGAVCAAALSSVVSMRIVGLAEGCGHFPQNLSFFNPEIARCCAAISAL
jgi:hypothetical protein